MCEADDCIKQCTFGIKGQAARFCKAHKLSNMVDVKNKVCEFESCTTRPTFNIEGTKIGRFCIKHKADEMINVMDKYCQHNGCNKISPAYDVKGGKGRFCVTHKTADMIDIKSKRCITEGCDSICIYDIKGGKGRFCLKHKTDGMIDVKNKKCEGEGCISQPMFDIKGGKGRFCVKHKTDEMTDVKNKRCIIAGCDLQPHYGIKGAKRTHCLKHKSEDMVDVSHKKCSFLGCTLRPNFGKTNGVVERCSKHKEDGMVNVGHKKCAAENCTSIHIPYDIKGGKGRFCSKHKTDDMMDVLSKRCEAEGCDIKSPSFDIKGGKGRFCFAHKAAHMINISSTPCVVNGCQTRVYYGKPGQKRSHCAKHRLPGMIVRPNSKCSDCKEPAIWGLNWVPKHCEKHKTEDEQNLIERACSSCNLTYILDKNNKCENCCPESWATARLAKQNAIMDYLDGRGLKGQTTDTVIDSGACGKERPDRVYEFEDKIVIIECDEHQHNNRERSSTCELARMCNIGQSFGGQPVYFIRWNPDDYCPDSDRKQPEVLAKRHKLAADLISDIKLGKTTLPVGLVSAIYLYYDGWSSLANENWTVLMPFHVEG